MQPELQLLIKGASYRSWFRVDVDSDFFESADAFDVTCAMPGPEGRKAIREGEKVEIYVGDDRQLAGVIDDVKAIGDKNRISLNVVGRDKGAHLVSSEADAIHAKDLTLKGLAEKLLKTEWGIRNVILSNEENRKILLGKKDRGSKAGRSRSMRSLSLKPRGSTKIDPGQLVAQILDDHTRRVGCTWWMTAGGDLVIGRPTYDQEPAFDFRLFKGGKEALGNNILPGWTVERSAHDRFSDLEVWGQGSGANGFSKFKAKATDPDLKERRISRRLKIIDSDARNTSECQLRADLEMGRRRLRGEVLRFSVAGWHQSNRVFAIDTLASVKIEAYDIDGVYWMAQRRFTAERNRRRTQFTFYPKGIYLA